MSTDHDPTLDTFERALLRELLLEVERNANDRPAPELPERVRPRRAWYASAAVVVAALIVALLVHVVRPEPAYAVTGRNGREITVRVMRLEGADRLEAELRRRGVASDITYLPPGKRCATPRYVERATRGLVLGVSAERFYVTIAPGTIGPGDTFVLSASVTLIPNGVQAAVEYGIATGRVSPCRVVDTP